MVLSFLKQPKEYNIFLICHRCVRIALVSFYRRDFMNREKLGSRLGFILLSAGCAIGVGNV